MYLNLRKKKIGYLGEELTMFEHPGDFLDDEDLEGEEWSALAIQAGYDGLFDKYYNAKTAEGIPRRHIERNEKIR